MNLPGIIEIIQGFELDAGFGDYVCRVVKSGIRDCSAQSKKERKGTVQHSLKKRERPLWPSKAMLSFKSNEIFIKVDMWQMAILSKKFFNFIDII